MEYRKTVAVGPRAKVLAALVLSLSLLTGCNEAKNKLVSHRRERGFHLLNVNRLPNFAGLMTANSSTSSQDCGDTARSLAAFLR